MYHRLAGILLPQLMQLKPQVTKFSLFLLLFQFEFVNAENPYEFTHKALHSIPVITKQINKILVSNINILITDNLQKKVLSSLAESQP